MRQDEASSREAFQPVAVRPSSEAPWLYTLRCVLDLQLLTIDRFLRPRLRQVRGKLLDVGVGEAPWRDLLEDVDYVGIDVEDAAGFGMRRSPSVTYYDGLTIPFADASFDHVLCVEVLEHVACPDAFVREMARVLRSGGSLLLTVPWSARLHHVPNDFHRFSRYALQTLLQRHGFVQLDIVERGNSIAVIANKSLVLTIKLMRPGWSIAALWRWPLVLAMVPLVALWIVAAHLTLVAGRRADDDPLGYGVAALRV